MVIISVAVLIPLVLVVVFLFSYPDPLEIILKDATTDFLFTDAKDCFPVPLDVSVLY